MAIGNLSGWNSLGKAHGMQAPVLSGLNSKQDVTFTTTARNTTALGTGDNFIRISVDAAGYINTGDVTVTAAAGDVLLAAGESIVIPRDGFTHVAFVAK